MDDIPIVKLGLILLVACVVAMLSRRVRLPYSVGLVIAGIGLALVGPTIDLVLTPDLIFTILLPPLIFEAALQLKWRPFVRDLPVTLTLAFPGVVLAAAIVAAGMHLVLGWSWLSSALFGVLISATDPVAVTAAFKEMKANPRLSLLVESESLLNDGAAAVGFAILAAVAGGAAVQAGDILGSFVWMTGGGVLIGACVAGPILLLAGRTDDHLVEITLTTIVAYGAFLLAEHLHMSGVLATLTAGLIVGNMGAMGAISDPGRDHVASFWEYAAFLANSVIFILIGAHETTQIGRMLSLASGVAVGLVLLGRVLAVYPFCALFARTSLKVDLRHQHVMVWGGLRGALALALALAVPDSIPEKGAIIACAFAVVAFSVFTQAVTAPLVLVRLGLTEDK
jgi:CPA1 family monovalent cation:H+ antiporter